MIRGIVSSAATLILWGFPLLNGCASCVKPDEQVILFPTDGYLSEDSKTWIVPIHGWIFEMEEDSVWRTALVDRLCAWLGANRADAENPVFRSRVLMFLADNERGKRLKIDAFGHGFVMDKSRENGHFEGQVRLRRDSMSNTATGSRFTLQTVACRAGGRVFQGSARLAPPFGISVISDIDDTVKITNVLDKKDLIANTFLRPFRPVPGMAERYREWAEQGALFHYVSASPWQLYPELASFMGTSGLPEGSFYLKDFRLFDQTFLNLFLSSEVYKTPIMESVLRTYPSRTFILVGDSGEKDPEIYGAVARRFPDQVRHIFIRNVSHEDADSQRFSSAFERVPKERWTIFEHAEELPRKLGSMH